MLKIDHDKKSLVALPVMSLADAAIYEVGDLQEYIFNSPDAFFAEIGQKLFLVGKEVRPSTTVQDRIDILALDEEGRAVVVELKRGNNKLHLLQAISYAGMVAHWDAADFLQLLDDKNKECLTDKFLDIEDTNDINRGQRVILVAEAYDYSVLVAAEWLSENFGVEIMCCRIALAEDSTSHTRYLACSIVFPAPELSGQAKRRGTGLTAPGKWTDWSTALADVSNPAVVAYFNAQIAGHCEALLRRRRLVYRIAGKRRWFVSARKKNAYVWQRGRFDGDVTYWQERLSQPDDVQPVDDETCLRFYLSSESDCLSFCDAATKDLQSVIWIDGVAVEDDHLDETEVG